MSRSSALRPKARKHLQYDYEFRSRSVVDLQEEADDLLGLIRLQTVAPEIYLDTEDFYTIITGIGVTPLVFTEAADSFGSTTAGATPLGSELLSNGTFASDTVWTKGAGWTIASGVASKTSGNTNALSQAITLTAGLTYRVEYTITSFTAGSVRVSFIGGTDVHGTTRSAAGTYAQYLVAASGNNFFYVSPFLTSFVGSIDNVSVKQLL